MPQNITTAACVLGAVLLLTAILHRSFKIFGAEVEGSTGRFGRIFAGFLRHPPDLDRAVRLPIQVLTATLRSSAIGRERYCGATADPPAGGGTDRDRATAVGAERQHRRHIARWGRECLPNIPARRPVHHPRDRHELRGVQQRRVTWTSVR